MIKGKYLICNFNLKILCDGVLAPWPYPLHTIASMVNGLPSNEQTAYIRTTKYWTQLSPTILNAIDLMSGVIWMERIHVRKWISPFSGHDEDGVLMESGSNQWVHLSHEAAQPANEIEKHIRTHYNIRDGISNKWFVDGNTYKSQQVAAVSIKTHWTML